MYAYCVKKDRKNAAGRDASRQRNVPNNITTGSENQSIPKENSPHVAAQIEADTQKMIRKINKWKGSVEDDEEEELGSLSTGDPRARWRR